MREGSGVHDDTATKNEDQSDDIAGQDNAGQDIGATAQSGHYALDIAGVLTELWDERLEGWQLERLPEEQTRITGYVRDQSELYGVIAALRNMGLTLLRVELITQSTQSEGESK